MKEKLQQLGKILITPAVKIEVLTDIDKFPEAKVIKQNLDKNIVQEIKMSIKQLPQINNLGKGEKETIESCIKEGDVFVTDDHQALNYAISRGLKPKTTEIVLLDLLKEKRITIKEFEEVFNQLVLTKSLRPKIKELILEKAQEFENERPN